MSVISFLITLFISVFIGAGRYHFFLILLWVISIIFLLPEEIINLLIQRKILIDKLINYCRNNILILVVILIPEIVRILSFNPNRIHQDDLIAAYISIKTNFLKDNFFGGIPVNKADWAGQFPSLFFALQKTFFSFFGESIFMIKLSTIPYVFLISLFLYLTVKKIFNKVTAVISLIILAFFPMGLYLETMGFHFVASTAIFMIFFYLCLINFQSNNHKNTLPKLTGIVCGFNYLFYMTSFIALPFLFLVYVVELFIKKRSFVLNKLAFSLFSFLIVLAPFLVFAVTKENYFLSRINQVFLVNRNVIDSFKSFYIHGIGGHGGYTLGHLAFFEGMTFFWFLGSLLVVSILIFSKIELSFVLLALILSLPAMLFSIPPPTYHRLSLTFPFIAIILSTPLYVFISKMRQNYSFKKFTIVIIMIVYVFNNYRYFQKAVAGEGYFEPYSIANYINKNYPKRKIYVASYPGFAFEKIYYFSKDKSAISITTDYHENIIKNFTPQEKYLYIVIFPSEFKERFISLDQKGKIIYLSKDYLLLAN